MTDGEKNGERMYAITESELTHIKSVIIEDAHHEYQIGFFERIRSRPLYDMCMERNGEHFPNCPVCESCDYALNPDCPIRNGKQAQPQDAAAGKAELIKFWNMRPEEREELVKCLLNIQLHLPWKEAREKTESINESIKQIYSILDMVHYNENQCCAKCSKASPGKASVDVLAELERDLKATISCNMRWGTSLEPYYVGVNTHATLMLQKIATLRQGQQP